MQTTPSASGSETQQLEDNVFYNLINYLKDSLNKKNSTYDKMKEKLESMSYGQLNTIRLLVIKSNLNENDKKKAMTTLDEAIANSNNRFYTEILTKLEKPNSTKTDIKNEIKDLSEKNLEGLYEESRKYDFDTWDTKEKVTTAILELLDEKNNEKSSKTTEDISKQSAEEAKNILSEQPKLSLEKILKIIYGDKKSKISLSFKTIAENKLDKINKNIKNALLKLVKEEKKENEKYIRLLKDIQNGNFLEKNITIENIGEYKSEIALLKELFYNNDFAYPNFKQQYEKIQNIIKSINI